MNPTYGDNRRGRRNMLGPVGTFFANMVSPPGSGRSTLDRTGTPNAQDARDGAGHVLLFAPVAMGRGVTVPEFPGGPDASSSEADRRDELRLVAVRRAYWDASKRDNPSELNAIHYVLVSALGRSPTDEECEAFFMRLPAEVIGDVIKWGLCDTEVRDRMHEFSLQS